MPMNKERERFRRESLETTEDYQKRDVPFTKSSHFFRAFSFVAFRRVSCSLFERAEDDMLKKAWKLREGMPLGENREIQSLQEVISTSSLQLSTTIIY